MEEDNVRDGENNFQFNVCILLLLCHHRRFIPVKKSMNCHLGKYALFRVDGYVCIPEQIVHPLG